MYGLLIWWVNLNTNTIRRWIEKFTKGEKIERIFVDVKEKHEMSYTNYRSRGKIATHTMITFAVMN